MMFFAALSGVLLGAILMNIINTLNISIDNRYINILLGGKPLQGVITGGLLVEHVFFGNSTCNTVYSSSPRNSLKNNTCERGIMNVPPIIHLAFRNFRYYLQRYTVILVTFVVVSAGFMVSLGIMVGMRNSILSKASRYFSGDIVIQAFEITADDPMRANIVNLSLPDIFMKKQMRDFETVSKRNLHLQEGSRLFFNGKYMNQRRIIGVEWGLEESILSDFSFYFGGMPHAGDMDGILISTTVAEVLGTSVGDRVLLSVLTVHGQRTTRHFTVRGIFNESSFFGYAPYVHKKALNELIGADGEYTTEIGIHLKNSIRHRRDVSAQEIYDTLRMEYEVFAPVDEYRRTRTAS